LAAGINRVVYGQAEPSERGGAPALLSSGVEVIGPFPDGEWQQLNTQWTHFQRTGQPFVTLKMAMSLDGRVGGPGNRPLRITGNAARAWTHQLRSQVGAVMVGTGTALADDPLLTVRDESGHAAPNQPLRVVIGSRPLPEDLALKRQPGEWLHLQDTDLQAALRHLAGREAWHVLVEGGPTLATALLERRLVDRVAWFIAPKIVGAGPVSLPFRLPQTHLRVVQVQQIGEDVLVIADPRQPADHPKPLGSR
jgi:diaminohydroxyphosphoribosylaminopyrimidine deaminase/5-amino-6-(5-phosphoribosylamino)uracil reductase